MHQVLMQRGSHSFIRYCASESVFAGLHRIAKLATSIAIAVAFTGIALPTSSAQAQTARFSVTGQLTPGQTTFAENEEASFILRLDGFPDDQDIATAEVELVVQQITTGFSTPQGNTFEGTFFDVVVEGDNSRAVTLSVGGGSNNRMKAIVAFDPDDSTAGIGQPAVITWTIRPKDISTTQTFRIRRTNNGRVVLKNSAGGTVSRLAPTFVENFTITPVADDNAILLSYTFQTGDTIPNIKTETPTNTSEVGVDWNPAVGINLLAGATATYPDGTAYECDSSSSGNCQIRFPGGRIANGGPVHATIPVVLPTQDEQGREFEIGKQVIPGTSAKVVFNPAIISEETRGHPGDPPLPEEDLSDFRPLYRSIAEDNDPLRVVAAFNQTFVRVPADTTARCTYGLGGDALYGEDYHIVDSSSINLPITALDAASPPPLRVVENDATNLAADNADNHLLINDACDTSGPITWSVRLVGDEVVKGNKRIAFVLREVQLFNSESNPLGVLAIFQPDTLVLTVVDDEVSDVGQVVITTLTGGAAAVEGQPINFTIGQDRRTISTVFVNYVITGIAEADLDSVGGVINGEVGSEVNAGGTGVDAHTASDDLRRGVIAISPNDGTSGTAAIFHITSANDDVPEGPETFTLTLSSRDNSVIFAEALRPNINAQGNTEPGVGRIQATITDDPNDTVPTGLTPAGIAGVSFVVLERSAANTTTSLNNTFTLSAAATSATLGYELTGPGAGDIAVTHGSGDAANRTTVTPNVNDPRKGTFTVTGTTGTAGSLQLTAAADNILEGTEAFTLTLFAGNPDNTRLELANGTRDYTISDNTPAVIPTLTWPGTDVRNNDGDRGTLCGDNPEAACDETLPIGPPTFPGGVLEGSTPHLLVALPDTVVSIDTVIPIITSSELDALVEPLYFDGNNRAVRAVIIPAGRSRASARVRIVSDHLSESPDEEVTFTLGEPVSGITEAEGILYADTLPATIIINDRPAVGANAVTWTSVTGQVNPGAGETHVANLTIRVDGGFTSDREAVSIYFETLADGVASNLSDLGEVSWKRAGSENVLPVISRNHIAVSRFNFSPASESDSTPVVTVGLYFTPKALISAGQQVEVNLTRVNVINRSAGLGLSPIRAILCNDNDNVPDEDGCDGYEFNAGDPKYGISGFTHASEVGPTDGGFNLTIAEDFRTPVGATTAGTINYSVGGTALRGITRDYTLEITATDPDNSNANTTDDLTTSTFGEVSIPFANLDNVISFTVRPVADAINEGTETVVITIEGIRFTGNDPVAITDSRELTVNIANAKVARMSLRDDNRVGAEDPDTAFVSDFFTARTTNDSSRPLVRLNLSDIPDDAFYADIAYTVGEGSTATEGEGEDYTIYRTQGVTGTAVGGTAGLGTSDTVVFDRDPLNTVGEAGREQVITTNSNDVDILGNLDYFLNVVDDDIVEPPETVIMNFTATLWACAVATTDDNTVCPGGGRGSQQVGPTIPFSFTFLINDNEAATVVRNLRYAPVGSEVINEDAANNAGRMTQVEFVGNGNARIKSLQTFFYNITDASGGAITDNALGVTADDFSVATNANVGACTAGARTSLQETEGVICRGVYTATGSTSYFVDLEIMSDELGENEEAFYVNLEPATLDRDGGLDRINNYPEEVEIADGTRALVTIAASDGGGPPPIVENRGSITTTSPVNLVRRDTTRTAVTFSATGLPLDPDGGASATRAIFQAQITAADGNTWVAAEDFILQDAATEGNPVTINTSGEFESGRLAVSAAGAATFTVYLDPSAGTQTGNESFRITLTAVKACKVDSDGACMGADLEPAVTIVGSPLVVNLGSRPLSALRPLPPPPLRGPPSASLHSPCRKSPRRTPRSPSPPPATTAAAAPSSATPASATPPASPELITSSPRAPGQRNLTPTPSSPPPPQRSPSRRIRIRRPM